MRDLSKKHATPCEPRAWEARAPSRPKSRQRHDHCASQQDSAEAVHEAESVGVGVVVNAREMDPADQREQQQKREAGPSCPRGLLQQGSKSHPGKYTEGPQSGRFLSRESNRLHGHRAAPTQPSSIWDLGVVGDLPAAGHVIGRSGD
jgi:hypothetical protein